MRQRLVYPALVVGVAGLVFLTNLGGAGLWDDDEPYYASCAREMLQRNDWVVPMFNGTLFPDKPPLMYWMMIAGFKLFGINELGARFAAALCGISTALATYAIGRRLFTAEVGLWGGLIVASTFLFTVSARAATVDSALALLSTLAILAFVRGEGRGTRGEQGRGVRGEGREKDNEKVTHYSHLSPLASHPSSSPRPSPLIPRPCSSLAPLPSFLMWACLGVGILAKGPIGLLLPAASIGLYLMIMNYVGGLQQVPGTDATRGWRRLLGHVARVASPINFLKSLGQMRPLLGVIVVLATALPWFLLVGARTDGRWTAEFFGNFNLRPFTKSIQGHTGPFWYYVPVVLIGFFPWSVFMFSMLVDAGRRVGQRHSWTAGYVLLACWAAVPIVFWSICSTKLPHYMVPITPAFALAAGAFLYHWLREPALLSSRPAWLSWVLTILAGCGFVAVIPIIAAYFLPGESLVGLVGLILVAGGALSWYLANRQRRHGAIIVFAAMSALMMTAVFGFATLCVDRHQNTRALMAAIREDCPGEAKMAAFGFMEKSHVFYAGHSLPFCKSPQEVGLVVGDALTYVLTDANGAAELQARLPGTFAVLIRQRRFLRKEDVMVLVHRPHARTGGAAEVVPSRSFVGAE